MVAINRRMMKPGDVLADGKYRIVEEVGSGAMGTVYRSLHTVLDRQVAIKVLNPILISVSNVEARFLREAKAASKIQHRNSVQILDYGSEGGWFYIVMEFLEGEELKDIIQHEAPLPKERIAALMAQVCSALTAAHDVGVIHRDLKPANIMVVSDRDDDGNEIQTVKVCDFGIAKVQTNTGDGSSDSYDLTATGVITGTPAYMSPEQAKGKKLDPRSDLYSCGVLMYIMATRELPFTAESPLGFLTQHVADAPPAPSRTNPDISKSLEGIIQKCLRKDPNARYKSAMELRRDLLILASDGSSEELNIDAQGYDKKDWTWGSAGMLVSDKDTYQTTKTIKTEAAPVAAKKSPWLMPAVFVILFGVLAILVFRPGLDPDSEIEENDTSLDVADPVMKRSWFGPRKQKPSESENGLSGLPTDSEGAEEELKLRPSSSASKKNVKTSPKRPSSADESQADDGVSDEAEASDDPEEKTVDESEEDSPDESSTDSSDAEKTEDNGETERDTELPSKEPSGSPLPTIGE